MALSEEIYSACKSKDLTGETWAELSNRFNFGNHEKLKSQYKRDKKARETFKEDGFSANVENGSLGESEVASSSFTQNDNLIHIVCDAPRVMSQDDIIKQFNIDLNVWKVKSYTLKSSEGYRKDRKVKWDVVDGKVTEGHVDDSGKMLIVTMYHVSVDLVRRVNEITEKSIEEVFKKFQSNTFSPVKIIPSQYSKNGKSLIVPIADLHIGLLATMQANNNVYNMVEMERLYLQTISQIKERVKNQKFEEVCFVIGNDFLNTDNLSNTTSHGTPQDSVGFWYEIVDKALELLCVGINSLLEISKVRVYNIVSNHDGQSMYQIMKTLDAIYKSNKDVWVDTSPLPRKYYQFGKTLIGLTHDMKINKGLETMTTEAKSMWSGCNKFYWLLAHLHTEMQYQNAGLLEIYRLPTISGYSRWANEKAFLNIEKKTQCFICDSEKGFTDVMYVIVD